MAFVGVYFNLEIREAFRLWCLGSFLVDGGGDHGSGEMVIFSLKFIDTERFSL